MPTALNIPRRSVSMIYPFLSACLFIFSYTIFIRLWPLKGKSQNEYFFWGGGMIWRGKGLKYSIFTPLFSFSSSGKLMAVASFDNRIRIFSTLVWTLVHEVDHFPSLHEGIYYGAGSWGNVLDICPFSCPIHGLPDV